MESRIRRGTCPVRFADTSDTPPPRDQPAQRAQLRGALRYRRQSLYGTYLAAALVTLAVLGFTLLTPPGARDLTAHGVPVTSYMRYESALHGGLPPHRRPYRALATISPLLSCSVVKAEDRRFFLHRGIEMHALVAAINHYVRGEHAGGGSTITQQLARNLYLTPKRSLVRKAHEALIAIRLESTLTKRRILGLYLNTVQWGSGIWGANEASEYYFRTTPDKLDAFQSSFLAAMLAAPSRAPTGANADRVLGIQRRVLEQLKLSKLITGPESSDALRAARQWHADVIAGSSWRVSLAAASALYRAENPLVSNVSGVTPHALGTCGYELEIARETGVASSPRQ